MLQGSIRVITCVVFGVASTVAWGQTAADKFAAGDTNRDGEIDAAEHKVALSGIFKRLDTNGDGNLHVDEMLKSIIDNAPRATDGRALIYPEAMRSVAVHTVNSYDRNRNGRVPLAEYLAAQDVFFAMMDRNRDGRLTLAEMPDAPNAPAGRP